MSHTLRKGESPGFGSRRASRCFEINGRWYVTTRGARYVGPFVTKEAADDAAMQLTRLLANGDDQSRVEAVVRQLAEQPDPASTENGE